MGPFVSALELGGTIGALAERLAPRCELLTTIDVSRTAAAMTRRRLAGRAGIRFLCGPIPDTVPEEQFDLIVASGFLYHLGPTDLDRTLAAVRARLVGGGRMVAVHWREEDARDPLYAAGLHARLREDPWFRSVRSEQTPEYLLDALERR
jgi:cyclopropane fatty-acyl-phospholipid synthase-like methyltransferase